MLMVVIVPIVVMVFTIVSVIVAVIVIVLVFVCHGLLRPLLSRKRDYFCSLAFNDGIFLSRLNGSESVGMIRVVR